MLLYTGCSGLEKNAIKVQDLLKVLHKLCV